MDGFTLAGMAGIGGANTAAFLVFAYRLWKVEFLLRHHVNLPHTQAHQQVAGKR